LKSSVLKALIAALVTRPAPSVSTLTSVIAVFGGTATSAASAGGNSLAPLFSWMR
jgi:hypothetical protein